MPTYVYHCDSCDTNFEAVQRFTDAPLTICPQGHEGVRKVITPPAIIFKGSGWYITDSKSTNGNKTLPAKSSDSSESSTGNDGAKSEKSESTSTSTGDSATPAKSPSSTEAA